MTDAVIELKDVRKTFRDFWLRPTVAAVDGLSLEVRRGEVFGLLGPNGSGKSTTIKMILGLLDPSGGSVKLFGKSPRSVAARRRLGYLPELSYLHPFLTAKETLMYYAGLCGLNRRVSAERTRRKRRRRIVPTASVRPGTVRRATVRTEVARTAVARSAGTVRAATVRRNVIYYLRRALGVVLSYPAPPRPTCPSAGLFFALKKNKLFLILALARYQKLCYNMRRKGERRKTAGATAPTQTETKTENERTTP